MNKADWIWCDKSEKKDRFVRFLDYFDYGGQGEANINISADTDYVIYINGKTAGFGQYPDYPYDKVYDKINITKHLKTGRNMLAILVRYIGDGDFFTNYDGGAGLYYTVEVADKIIAKSGEHTLSCEATDYVSGKEEKITRQLGYRINYDMRGYDDWNLYGYEPKDFSKSVIIQKDRPHRIRPIKKLELGQRVMGRLIRKGGFIYNDGKTEGERQVRATLYDNADDSAKMDGIFALYDLGREEVGFLNFKINAPSGTKISVGYGEHIADGIARAGVGGRDYTFTYIAREGVQEFLCQFLRLGARYIQIFGVCKQIEIEYISLIPVVYLVSPIKFAAGSLIRQKIYDTSVRTLQLCMHDHYEDCPLREQAFYAMDSRNQMLCGYYAFNEFEFARENLRLIGKDNRADGLLSICFPTKVDLAIPSFSLHYILAMYEYMTNSGDIDFIKNQYGKMNAVIRAFTDRIKDGLISIFPAENHWNFYEWNKGMSGCNGTRESEIPDAPLNAFLSICLKKMSKIAEIINKTDDCKRFLKLSDLINKRISEEFYVKQTGLFETVKSSGHYSELVNALCILCGAGKENSEKIAEIIAGKNSLIKASLSFMSFVYDALLCVNKEKYKIYILAEIDRQYGYMLDKDATSFWETLEGQTGFNNGASLCHGWSAMPIYYYNLLL